jgi:hypothetical protein
LPLFRLDWRNGNDSEEQKDEYHKGTENGMRSEAGRGAPCGCPA